MIKDGELNDIMFINRFWKRWLREEQEHMNFNDGQILLCKVADTMTLNKDHWANPWAYEIGRTHVEVGYSYIKEPRP